VASLIPNSENSAQGRATASAFRPDAVIFVSEAMPWVALPPGIPAFDRGYDFAQVLPPDRLARMRALIEWRKSGEG
jgi:hypothetical protein